MNSPTVGLRVASVLFGLLCLAQIMRLVMRPDVLVAGHVMPLWPSVLAVVVLGAMCVWLWSLTRRRLGAP
jgi:hypothetical protein